MENSTTTRGQALKGRSRKAFGRLAYASVATGVCRKRASNTSRPRRRSTLIGWPPGSMSVPMPKHGPLGLPLWRPKRSLGELGNSISVWGKPAAGQPNCCPAQPLSTLLLSVAAGGGARPAVERWDAAWGQEGRLGATNRLTDWPFLAFPFLCAEALVVSLSQVMRAHTRGLFRWVHGVATRARDTTQPCTLWELVATS